MKLNPALLKAASIILILLGVISMVIVGISILEMMGVISAFDSYFSSIDIISVIIELAGVGLFFITGIFGFIKNYDKADRFGKILILFALLGFVFKDSLVLNVVGTLTGLSFNLTAIIWIAIVSLCCLAFGEKVKADKAKTELTAAAEEETLGEEKADTEEETDIIE